MSDERLRLPNELAPCPICGMQLSPANAHGYHDHPANGCLLSGFEVSADDIQKWNLRAASPLTPDPQELLEIARATGLRSFLHGVNAEEARDILEAYQVAVDGRRNTIGAPRVEAAAPLVAQQEPVAWINYNAATGARSVSFVCESELASIPLNSLPRETIEKLAGGVMGQAQLRLLMSYVDVAIEKADAQRTDAVPIVANLEGLREKLLAPREIVRDEQGWLTHPAFPVCDEDVRADKFLEAFRIEAAFVGMETDVTGEVCDRYFDSGEPDCSAWTPTPPAGDGWLLLEIYDTEDGPYALFGRDAYEVEQARKREHPRKLAESIHASRPDTEAP